MKVNFIVEYLFSLEIINTTVAKGEEVIERAHPEETASATKVGSVGNIFKAPNRLPKNTAIIIGLTPSQENGTINIDIISRNKCSGNA